MKTLRQIQSFDKRYFHQFQDGGQDVFVECTKQEYDALGLVDAPQPTPPTLTATWIQSVSEGLHLTDGGKEYWGTAPEGTFVEFVPGYYAATLNGKHYGLTDKDINKASGVLNVTL